jgi:hypothetical protein
MTHNLHVSAFKDHLQGGSLKERVIIAGYVTDVQV